MDDSTVEALREVLQDMTMAIELISSGERSGEALINFIEEMLKTIEAWAAKYNVILDDGVMATESAQSSRPNPSDLSSYPNYLVANSKVQGSDEDVKQQLDTANRRTYYYQTEGEAHHQSVESLKQDGEGNNEKGGEHLLRSDNDETQMDGRRVADKSKAKPLRRVSRKTRSQAASTSTDGGFMYVDGTPTGDGGAKVNSLEPLIESPKLAEATTSGDATSPSQASEIKGDVMKSPDWLPKGWITEMKIRGTGGSAGSKDKCYFDPTSKCRFRSKQEVLAFVGSTKRKRGRPRKSESLVTLSQTNDESPGHTNDAAHESIQESVMSLNPELQVPSNTVSDNNTLPSATTSIIATSTEAANNSMPTLDTTRPKRGRPRKIDSVKNLSQTKDESPGHASAAAQAGGVPELAKSSTIEVQVPSNRASNTTNMPTPVTASSTAASSGPANSCIPMPHQSGQTSEWLVYESLASLPFPMFEHLRLVESNANKLANNNSPPTLWPWMLGNAEGLKKPFVDTKPDESKTVEESKQDQNALIPSTGDTQAAEVVPKRPKKAARKNAS